MPNPPSVIEHGSWTNSPRVLVMTTFALFVANVVLVYPGIMTWDSRYQYRQAVLGSYNEWNPPIMAALWRALLPVSNAGSALLVFHSLLYWASVGLIALALLQGRHRVAAWATVLVGLSPHLLLLNSFIHKDVGHSVALTLAFSVILFFKSRGRKPGVLSICAVTLALLYATFVRSNGIFGAAPIAFYAFASPRHSIRRLALTGAISMIALVAISIPLNIFLNRVILKAEQGDQIVSVVHFDLAGVAHYSRDPSVYPVRVPALSVIDRCYEPRLWDALNIREDCKGELGVHNGVKNKQKLLAWPKSALRHPLSYATHRLRHFNEELFGFVGPRHWDWPVYVDPLIDPIRPGRIEDRSLPATDDFANFPLTAPMTSFVTGLVVLWLAAAAAPFRNAWQEGAYHIALAGTLYTGGFLVVGVASMYRYQQFGMTSTLLAIVLLLAGIDKHRRTGAIVAIASSVLSVSALITLARFTLGVYIRA